jgi:hypothetical protein
MLQVFYTSVVKIDRDVAHVAKGYTRMFQVYVPTVSSVLDVCCKCFIWMLQKYIKHMFQVFHLDVAYICNGYTHVFFCVSDICCNRLKKDICCNCFSCFRTYVASVSSGCYKSRSSVAHVSMGPTYCRACTWEVEG